VTNSKFWVDGVPISQLGAATSTSANTFTTGLQMNIGSYPLISNMMYFENYEIDQANVDKLYGYGSPLMSTATLTQAPNAWYKFDASEVYDSSNTQWQIANNVLSDKAYSFNGTNNIEITQNSSIQTSTFSVGLWIKGYPQGGTTILENGGINGLTIKTGISGSYGHIQGYIGNGSPAPSITDALNGEWNFIFFTFKDGYLRRSSNGVYVSGAGTGTLSYDSSKGLFIGSDSSSSNGFVGEIAQVVYYDNRGPNNAGALYGNLPANPPPSPLTGEDNPDLVSWWKLDAASITDSNGSNNGTNNGATLIDINVGRPAGIGGLSSGMTQANLVTSNLLTTSSYSPYALNFDGNDYLTASNSTSYSSYSISCWVNARTLSSYGRLVSLDSVNHRFLGLHSDGTLISGYASPGWNQLFTTSTINTDTWNHIVLVDNGTNTKIYVNTVENTLSNSIAVDGPNYYIGSYGGSQNFFDGKMSNISIWNYSLDPSQVREIYNEGLPSNLHNFSGTAPVTWWQLGSNSSFASNWTCLDEIGSTDATSQSMLENAIVDGVGTSGNGISTNMATATNISGSSPSGEGNSLSVNMTLANLTTGVV